MRTMLRWMVALVVAVTAIGTALAGIAPAGPTSWTTFKAEGDVSATDAYPVTPLKEAFRLGPPISNATGGVEKAYESDGSLIVRVDANTSYYYYDAARARYLQGTYDQVVKQGEYVRVNGKYAKVGDVYETYAKQVYLPPKTTPPPPPNPLPTNLKDYTLSRHFASHGDVTQEGTNVLIYSDYFGFVLGNLTYTNNAHVQAVADHHFGKIPVVATDATTKFRIQDQSTGRYRTATKDETIVRGEPVFVAGRYTWDLNDWRFFANYVWKPDRNSNGGAGNFVFSETTRVNGAGSSPAPGQWEDRSYLGETFAGDNNIDPGPIEITSTSWAYDAPSNSWVFNGNWKATQAQGFGFIEGTLSGTWKRGDGTWTGSVILTNGTGRFAGLTGFGNITLGTGVGTLVTNQPPSTLDGQWQINLFRDA